MKAEGARPKACKRMPLRDSQRKKSLSLRQAESGAAQRSFENYSSAPRRADRNQRMSLAIARKVTIAASYSWSAASRSVVPGRVASRAIWAAMTRSKALRHSGYQGSSSGRVDIQQKDFDFLAAQKASAPLPTRLRGRGPDSPDCKAANWWGTGCRKNVMRSGAFQGFERRFWTNKESPATRSGAQEEVN
jgi:hypothetical protein